MSLCELAKCRRVVTAVLAVAACAGLAGAAHAHPHVWATVRSEIILNADHQITGVRHAWTFDEFYSAMAVQGLDTNGDGVFSAKELEPLAEVNIKSLKDFDYFTFVHIGDADNLPLKPPENYSLDYDKSLLTLHFTLPAREADRYARPGGSGRRLRSVLLRRLRLRHRSAGEIVGQLRSKAAPPRSRSPIPNRRRMRRR